MSTNSSLIPGCPSNPQLHSNPSQLERDEIYSSQEGVKYVPGIAGGISRPILVPRNNVTEFPGEPAKIHSTWKVTAQTKHSASRENHNAKFHSVSRGKRAPS